MDTRRAEKGPLTRVCMDVSHCLCKGRVSAVNGFWLHISSMRNHFWLVFQIIRILLVDLRTFHQLSPAVGKCALRPRLKLQGIEAHLTLGCDCMADVCK